MPKQNSCKSNKIQYSVPKVRSGAQSEPRRVVKLLELILTISHQHAMELTSSYKKEFGELQEICTMMSREYVQWSRNLSLELPIEYYQGFEPSPDSTLKACAPTKGSPIDQQVQARLRAMFIDELYKLLPADEKQTYSDLLLLRHFDNGLPDDAGAMYSLQLIEDNYFRLYSDLEEMKIACDIYADDRPLPPETLSDLSVLTAEKMGEFIKAIKREHPCTPSDSLAARLILNSSVNRATLELDELTRLHQNAYAEMKNVVYLLAGAIPDGPIDVKNDDEIYRLIQKIFDLEAEELEAPEKWRALTDETKPLILNMSDYLLEQYCINRSQGRIDDFRVIHLNPYNKLLMAACLGWAYCTQTVHDLRIPGMKHRKVKILHSRSKAEDKTIPPSLLVNMFRQYSLLFYSNQHLKRSEFALRDYSKAANLKRLLLRQLFVQDLKSASLAQWKAITIQLNTMMADK